MKIAINTLPLLSPLTGIGHYIYQISKALADLNRGHSYTYYYGYYSSTLASYGGSENLFFSKLKGLTRKIPGRSAVCKTLRGIKQLGAILSRREFDVYFEPNYIPLKIHAKKTVVTVADFSFKLHPEWHPKDRLEYFGSNFWTKIRNADRVIFISDYMRRCAIEEFGFSPEKLRTIHLGFDRALFRPYSSRVFESLRGKYNLPNQFILSVGSLEPRKNLKKLILAYMGLDVMLRRNFKLVLVGFSGWNNQDVMRLLDKIKGDVVYLGYIPTEDLAVLYSTAELFVYPSFYEGFGLPPLEAMSCGCPVVVSNATSLPEVCGDAVAYVDPYCVDDISRVISELLNDKGLRDSLSARGLKRAELFSWEKSAAQHLKVFNDVVAN